MFIPYAADINYLSLAPELYFYRCYPTQIYLYFVMDITSGLVPKDLYIAINFWFSIYGNTLMDALILHGYQLYVLYHVHNLYMITYWAYGDHLSFILYSMVWVWYL